MTKKKEIGMNDLARMMASGFADMGKRFEEVDKKFEVVFEGMSLMRDDIHDIKTTLGPLVRTIALQDNEMKKMNLRIIRLEKFVGVAGE